jgi:thioredoxin
MKQITVGLMAALLLFGSCNAQSNKPHTNTQQSTHKTTTMGTIHLTKEEFLKKVVNYEANPEAWNYLGDKPCVIDFYADWCGPCKAVAPILEELAKTYDGKIYIYKINTDQEQELAGAFGIRSIPSLLFVPMKGKPQMSMGALPKQQLVEAIENILLKKD